MTVGLAANVMFVVENALAERDDERRIWCSIVELCFLNISFAKKLVTATVFGVWLWFVVPIEIILNYQNSKIASNRNLWDLAIL